MKRSRFARLQPAALGLALASLPAFAAQPPDAGQSLESARQAPTLPAKPATALPEASPAKPALPLSAGVTIPLREFRLSGVTAFAEAELLGLIQDAIGKELTLADLQTLAERLTRHYRDHGYLLARAYIPAQDIQNGRVEIAVLEGRLGKISVDNRSALSAAAVDAQLAPLRPGEVVDSARLERGLLLLNDLPGVEVKSTLKPGAAVGTTDLDIQVDKGRRLTGAVDMDNHGNRFIGDLRAGLTLNLNNPAGRGDVLSLRAMTASGLDYARLSYLLPVGENGSKLGASYSGMRYDLGRDFSAVQAHGSAEIGSLYLLHPFLRSRATNLNGQLAFDRKRLEDRIDSTATISDKILQTWTLGLSGDHVDGLGGGGITTWSASLVAGDLDLDPTSRWLDAAGHRTQGAYIRLGYQLARWQRLGDQLNFYGQLSGQWANKNLDSAEKFSLGGAYGVRAYPQGEAPADDAALLNLELRYALTPDWQLTAFVDSGKGRLNHTPLPADLDNTRTLSGAGVGVIWSHAADFAVTASLAWKTTATPVSDVDRTPRLWVQGVKYF